MIIEQAIRAIDPDYEITAKQQHEIDRADDPDGVAAVLAEQVELNRELIAQGFGVSPEHVTAGDGLSVAVLTHPVSSRTAGSDGMRLAEMVPLMRAFEIGRRSVKRIPDPVSDAIAAIYLLVLGREPDPLGLRFYVGLYRNGVKLSFLVADMERNKAAGAR